MDFLVLGLFSYFGVILLAVKLPTRLLLELLGRPFQVDLCATVGLFLIYYGSVSGIMAATIAALLISMSISIARKLIGYRYKGAYYPGYWVLRG